MQFNIEESQGSKKITAMKNIYHGTFKYSFQQCIYLIPSTYFVVYYTDDLVLLTNTPVQVECLLQSLELVARGIGLYMTSCSKQDGAISTSNDKPLNLIEPFLIPG